MSSKRRLPRLCLPPFRRHRLGRASRPTSEERSPPRISFVRAGLLALSSVVVAGGAVNDGFTGMWLALPFAVLLVALPRKGQHRLIGAAFLGAAVLIQATQADNPILHPALGTTAQALVPFDVYSSGLVWPSQKTYNLQGGRVLAHYAPGARFAVVGTSHGCDEFEPREGLKLAPIVGDQPDLGKAFFLCPYQAQQPDRPDGAAVDPVVRLRCAVTAGWAEVASDAVLLPAALLLAAVWLGAHAVQAVRAIL